MTGLHKTLASALLALLLAGGTTIVRAGNQQYEPLAASVQAALHAAVADQAPLDSSFQHSPERARWLAEMSQRLARRIPDEAYRSELLRSVHYEATRAGLDPQLVLGLIQVESGYNKYATSPKGAQGLMQLIPETARQLGVRNVYDPRENIEAGVRYLKQLQAQFKDDRLALAAYNAGPGAVSRYGWIPPYSETQNYVYQVGKRYGEAKRVVETRKQQTMTAAAPKLDGPRPIEEFVDSEGRLHIRNR